MLLSDSFHFLSTQPLYPPQSSLYELLLLLFCKISLTFLTPINAPHNTSNQLRENIRAAKLFPRISLWKKNKFCEKAFICTKSGAKSPQNLFPPLTGSAAAFFLSLHPKWEIMMTQNSQIYLSTAAAESSGENSIWFYKTLLFSNFHLKLNLILFHFILSLSSSRFLLKINSALMRPRLVVLMMITKDLFTFSLNTSPPIYNC